MVQWAIFYNIPIVSTFHLGGLWPTEIMELFMDGPAHPYIFSIYRAMWFIRNQIWKVINTYGRRHGL